MSGPSRGRSVHRLRSRRGVVSGALVLLAVGGLLSLPFAAHYGVLPPSEAVGAAHEVAFSVFYAHVMMNDSSPGFYWGSGENVVSANSTIALVLYNNGTTTHSFSVYMLRNQVISATTDNTPAKLNTTWATAPGPNFWLPGGTNLSTTLNFSDPGTYQVVSLYPYQFQSGFTTTITVLPAGSATKTYVFDNATSALTFVPAILTAPANTPIVFEVTAQQGGHTFSIDMTSNDTTLVTGTSLPSPLPPGLANTPVNLELNNQGQTYASAPTILKAGVYWFVCEIPGHFQQGMWGKIYVGLIPSPPPNVPQITQVMQYGYLALAGIIVSGAAFLVLMGQNERPALAGPAPREH